MDYYVAVDGPSLVFDLKIWFDIVNSDNQVSLLGEQKIILLQTIDKLGSIKAAAEELGIDFHKAYDMIDNVHQKITPYQLINSERGRKGGTQLTNLGKVIIEEYQKINSFLLNARDRINTELQNDMLIKSQLDISL